MCAADPCQPGLAACSIPARSPARDHQVANRKRRWLTYRAQAEYPGCRGYSETIWSCRNPAPATACSAQDRFGCLLGALLKAYR